MAIHKTSASFMKAFSAVLKKAEKDISEVVKDTAVDLTLNLTLRSAVDSGRFRGNWNMAINQINYNTTQDVQNNAVERSARVVEGYKLGDTINITNSLPYAARLEYEGWSKQTPDGTVRITLLEYPQILKRRIRQKA